MDQKESNMEINRLVSEYIRGIAIVFVILGHILGGVFEIIDGHITNTLGIGGVNIFLLLSGYGLYKSYRKEGMHGKLYWDKKIKRVFCPYAIITVIYYLYMMLQGFAPGFPALLSNILCLDYSRTMDGTMWYMSFLLLWYLAFFAVFYFKGAMIGRIGMLLLLACSFRAYWLKEIFDECAWQFSTNAFAFPCGVGLGYLMDLLNNFQISEKNRRYLFTIIRATVFLASMATLVVGILQIVFIDYWICGIALFFVLYTVLSLPKKEIKLLKWLGINSFLIYLIEGKLIALWGQFRVINESIAAYLFSYVAAIIVTVYLYHFGIAFLGRFRNFWDLRLTEHQA